MYVKKIHHINLENKRDLPIVDAEATLFLHAVSGPYPLNPFRPSFIPSCSLVP